MIHVTGRAVQAPRRVLGEHGVVLSGLGTRRPFVRRESKAIVAWIKNLPEYLVMWRTWFAKYTALKRMSQRK